MTDTAVAKACVVVGGQSRLSRVIGVSPATINQWVKGIRPIPEERCPSIEHATSGEVTCEELRPDLVWIRIPDGEWPHPSGRPLVDHYKKAA